MNDYRPYLMALQKRLPLFLLLSLIAAAVAYGIVARQGVSYKVHFSYVISLAEREEGNEYTFDGFYALQATDLFTTTLASLIQTPEVIVAAYQEAGLPLPTDDARRLFRSVVAQKTAPQLIEVVVGGSNKEAATRLAAGVMAATELQVQRYHDEGIPALDFRVVPSTPWTGVSRPAVKIIVGSVFVVTLAFLVNIFLLWRSVNDAHRR